MMTAHRVLLIDLVSGNQFDEVKKLIQSGCDVNEKNYVGHSAIMAAVEANTPKILAVLLEAGANPDEKDGIGRSALSRARDLGHDKIAALIEEALARREQLKPTNRR